MDEYLKTAMPKARINLVSELQGHLFCAVCSQFHYGQCYICHNLPERFPKPFHFSQIFWQLPTSLEFLSYKCFTQTLVRSFSLSSPTSIYPLIVKVNIPHMHANKHNPVLKEEKKIQQQEFKKHLHINNFLSFLERIV